ncbi:MAG: hypothetical protein HQL72_04560 [Magnetococcales bacterium]|nr:hypothetical protein [Magnetococcales bacterium]
MEKIEGTKKVGIVGGGIEGKSLLEVFAKSKGIELLFVVDADSEAPAMKAAAKMGLKTLTRLDMAMKNFPVDFLFDAGSTDEEIETYKAEGKVVPSAAALLLIKMLEENRGHANQQIFSDLSSVRKEIDRNTRDASKALHGIEKISNELEVLAINAGIQASRAGEFGKGFSVVAGEVKSTARVARELAGEIDRIIGEVSSSSINIEQALKKVT